MLVDEAVVVVEFKDGAAAVQQNRSLQGHQGLRSAD